jgi:hypothetical protein
VSLNSDFSIRDRLPCALKTSKRTARVLRRPALPSSITDIEKRLPMDIAIQPSLESAAIPAIYVSWESFTISGIRLRCSQASYSSLANPSAAPQVSTDAAQLVSRGSSCSDRSQLILSSDQHTRTSSKNLFLEYGGSGQSFAFHIDKRLPS